LMRSVATSTTSSVERSTLEGFRRGEAEAFAEVIRAYSPMARSIVNRYWSGAFHREEAMQEIWVHAFKKRESLDPSRLDEFGAWFTALARNRCIDLLRREGREIGPDIDNPSKALENVQTAPAQEQAVEKNELNDAVEAFLDKLEPQWRMFYEMNFVLGLGYNEISERLSISRTRCKYMKRVLVGRARRDTRLLAALGRHDHAGGANAP
jgi:RNA polymerase sigma factor (sigma-70 family)